jgi:hypothetical protein
MTLVSACPSWQGPSWRSEMDADGDGVIGLADATLLVAGDADVAAAVVAEADLDGDGVVSLADFAAVLLGNEAHILLAFYDG